MCHTYTLTHVYFSHLNTAQCYKIRLCLVSDTSYHHPLHQVYMFQTEDYSTFHPSFLPSSQTVLDTTADQSACSIVPSPICEIAWL